MRAGRGRGRAYCGYKHEARSSKHIDHYKPIPGVTLQSENRFNDS